MGFDFYINISFNICPATGKPFSYGPNSEKIYGIPSIEIPEPYRRFVQERGHIFHAYTDRFGQEGIYSVGVEELLDRFPTWTEIVEDGSFCEDLEWWSEKDHDAFKEALEWFSVQSYSFIASWC